MDSVIEGVYLEIQNRLVAMQNKEILLVGIAGVPGSGKSSFTSELLDKLIANGVKATVISMDGWHYTREELSKFPDPAAAFARRGAPQTFDAEAYTEFVKSLKVLPRDILKAPTFSHSIKDPTPAGLIIDKDTQIAILEGNYVLLDEPRWKEAANMLNMKIWVDLDESEARTRLIKRHLASGICKNEEEAYYRVENNDIQNGRFARANLVDGTKVIKSIDDVKYRV